MRKVLGMLIVTFSIILLFGACGNHEEFSRNDEGKIMLNESQFANLLYDKKVSRVIITSEVYYLKGADELLSWALIDWAKESADFTVSNILMDTADLFGFNSASAVTIVGILRSGDEFVATLKEDSHVTIIHTKDEGFLIFPNSAIDWRDTLVTIYSRDPWNVEYTFTMVSLGELDLSATPKSPMELSPIEPIKIRGSGFDTGEETPEKDSAP